MTSVGDNDEQEDENEETNEELKNDIQSYGNILIILLENCPESEDLSVVSKMSS